MIKRPMDLSAIRARLDSGGYSTLKEVHEDLMLMWNNCKEYNGAASDLSKVSPRCVMVLLLRECCIGAYGVLVVWA